MQAVADGLRDVQAKVADASPEKLVQNEVFITAFLQASRSGDRDARDREARGSSQRGT
jgi:hypothetical protein